MAWGKHTVKIDKALYEKLTEVARRAGYSSTDELIQHVLEREASGSESGADAQDTEKQLRGLGYVE